MSSRPRRSLTRRSFLGIGVAGLGLAVVPLLQSCAGSAPPSPTQAPAAPPPTATTASAVATPAAKTSAVKPGTKIQVATRLGTDAEIMSKSVVGFTSDSGIQAEAVSYPAEPEYWAKVQALYSTKQVADVIWASVGNLHNFANRGILGELDSLIKADNYDLSDYLPNALQTCSWKGKLYAMPWGGHPGNAGLLYNVDLLNKAGYNVTEDPDSLSDWTYDKLAEAAQKLTVQSGGKVTQFGYAPGTDYLSLLNVIGAYGGDFYTSDGSKLDVDSDQYKQGLGWVRDIFTTFKAAPTPSPDVNNDELFASGKIALYQSGYWGQFTPGDKAINGKFKWNVAVQPKGPAGKRGTQLTINGQTVSSVSQNRDAAWQFVKWLMDPKNHIPIVLAGGSRPALRKSVLDSPDLMTKMKAHKVFAALLKESEPWREPANLRWPEFNSTVQQVYAAVWTGNQTLDQSLPDAKKKLQDIMDKPMI